MQQSTTSPADVRRSIADADRRFMEAFNAGDIEKACELIYTRNARVATLSLRDGQKLAGKYVVIWKQED